MNDLFKRAEYREAYATAEAGGMSDDECHDFAVDQASRAYTPVVVDPLQEARRILKASLEYSRQPYHAMHCAIIAFDALNRMLPPSHPAWKNRPACSCWVGCAEKWLSENP